MHYDVCGDVGNVVSGYGGGISVSIDSAANTALSFVNVTATSNAALAGRSRTRMDRVSSVVASLTGPEVMVVCTVMCLVTLAMWCARWW
jgi:hypothetical protein